MTDATMASAPVNPPLIARVKNGRLVLDVPTDLPEGAQVMLHRDEECADDLTDEERAELHEEILLSMRQIENGEGVDGDIVMAELRARLTKP